jgi:hypothetical protein
MNVREQLRNEALLLDLAIGEALHRGPITVIRVASPFRDGPRYNVFRNGRQLSIGPKGDPYLVLAEAATCL